MLPFVYQCLSPISTQSRGVQFVCWLYNIETFTNTSQWVSYQQNVIHYSADITESKSYFKHNYHCCWCGIILTSLCTAKNMSNNRYTLSLNYHAVSAVGANTFGTCIYCLKYHWKGFDGFEALRSIQTFAFKMIKSYNANIIPTKQL